MKTILLLIIALVCSAVASPQDPRTPREFEQWSGSEYVPLTDAQRDRLARAAIAARKSGICNVHLVKMLKKRVPIHFGLLDFSDPYYSHEISRFPHAHEYVNGGCEVDPIAEKKLHSTLVCPECRQAEWRWALAHPKHEIAKYILAHR
jgi:hypothetical protein